MIRAWVRRYLTGGGRVLAAAGAFSLVAGIDPVRTQLAGIFAVAVALGAAAALVGMARRVRLEGELRLPPRVVAGSLLQVGVEVCNRSRRQGYDLEACLDRLPRGLRPHLEGPEARCDRLKSDQSALLGLRVTAEKRGAYQLGPAYVGTTYPFGIWRLGQRVGSAARLLVTPRIHPMRSLELAPGMRYQPGGVPLASQTGESLEFVGVREYRQGDSLRKVHWKLWARRGIPVVREYSQEYFTRIGLILDSYRPPNPGHFEAAVEVAASVASFLAHQEAIVDFFAAGPEIWLLSMGRHLGTIERIIDLLACVEPCREAPYEQLELRLGDLMSRLSALLVVTTSMNPERRAFLDRLRGRGTPVRVLMVGEQEEPGVTRLAPDRLSQALDQL